MKQAMARPPGRKPKPEYRLKSVSEDPDARRPKVDHTVSTKPIIRVRGLVNRFGSQTIHEGLALDVMPGEILGVVGGSGSGKSVLLRTIVGLNKPVSGTVEVFGRNMLDVSEAERIDLEKRWGVLFQDGALFSSMTVAENIEVPLRETFQMPQELMDDIAVSKIALVGLPLDSAQKYPAQLSGGMRKRAALARALALDPERRRNLPANSKRISASRARYPRHGTGWAPLVLDLGIVWLGPSIRWCVSIFTKRQVDE